MKKTFRWLAALLALVVAVSAMAACNKGGTGGSDEHVNTVTETDYPFITAGTTDYRIVIPENAEENVLLARDELVYFTREATGITMQVVTDAGLTWSEDMQVISLGPTTLAEQAGVTATRAEYGISGTRLVTEGRTVFLTGATDFGALYAVYDFLQYAYGYHFYAQNEWTLNRVSDSNLLDFDVKTRADIDVSAIGYAEIYTDPLLRARLRQQTYWGEWIMSSHSYFNVVPPQEYYKDHRDWYSPNCLEDGLADTGNAQGNLCLTNVDKDVFFNNLIDIVADESSPYGNYYGSYLMLGQQDNFDFCNCPDCTAQIEADGGNPTGIVMRFTNEMARRLQAWLDENDPDREITVVAFAYNATATPPVTFNSKTGGYDPISSDVVADDNVAIMFVPPRYNYTYGYDHFSNQENKNKLLGWSSICQNMFICQYCVNFDEYMLPYDAWGSMKPMAELYAEHNVQFIFDEGRIEEPIASFSDMALYVKSSLNRDSSLSTEELINDFAEHYYKQAAPKIMEYFNLLRMHFAELSANYGQDSYSGGDWHDMRFWPESFLIKSLDLLDEAFAAIEPLRTEDYDLWETLYDRVLRETLSTRYWMLTFYPDYYINYDAEVQSFESDCATFGIYSGNEIE